MTEVPVRVAVRVRPLIGQEVVRNVAQCIHVIPEKPQLILGKDRGFTFDHVFPSSTLQNEVYEVCVEPLLKSCFEGYNATVFAYGQTGSGKTYTIGGSNTAGLLEEEYGIVPRAAKQLFQITEERKHKVQYTVRVSYIEIYMEELKDLLDLETASKDIHIREDENGNTIVAGASEQVVYSADEMMSCLDAGSAGRHFGTTNMNEHSSRSHSVFTVYIDQRPITDGSNLEDIESELQEKNVNKASDNSDNVFAKFHFVDLAGSERAHRTGNVGERFKESVFINSGLLALGNVISSLADSKKKVTHIPYRDSKVTRLLKDSLGGNARTVMITCLSPSNGDFAENLNSLKYATRARNIRNRPVINRDPQNARLVEMQNEIQALREELQRHRGSTASTAAESLNPGRIRFLEEELNSCRSCCEMYRKSALSAAAQLKSLYSSGAMTNSQTSHYERWLKSLEQIKVKSVAAPVSNKESQCDVIEQLKHSLNKYKEDLASDEEIFAEKTKEINSLTDHIRELQEENSQLDRQLNDAIIRLKRQEDQLFHQQLQLNQQLLKKHNQEERLVVGSSSNEPLHRHRAFSEPVNVEEPLPQQRKPYTSPPTLITLERIIDGFRARSQLLVSQHEEEDEVNQSLSDTSESEEEDEVEKAESKLLGGTWNTGTKKRSSHIPVINGRVKKDKEDQAKSKVTHPKLRPRQKMETTSESEAINELRSSTHVIKREVDEAELRLHDAHQKLRDLTMSVRYKEEVVSQLMKSEKEAKEMKMQYNEKIKRMKLEVEKARNDLEETKKALDEVESKANFELSEKQKLENEYKKKLNSVEAKLQALKKKQKDKEKVATFHEEREKKVQELESHIHRMRNQQEALQRKLKEESENKAKREREMQKHLQKIKELETQTLQQQKLLKRKTEEVVVAQRRLRNVNKQSSLEQESEEYSKLEERRRWLDAEVENMIKRKQATKALEEELKKREQIVVDREAMLAERSELEIKKLRSSQVLSKDVMRLSAQLGEVERKIQEKGQYTEGDENGGLQSKKKEDLRGLHRTREELLKQRDLLEQKLQEGTLLIPAEERRLIELDEGIEALEAAIEFKNDTIASQRQQLEINKSLISETILAENERNSLKAKLESLAPEESVMLLSKYFVKVVELRETERQLQLQCSDLDVRVKEQERIIGELGRGLQQSELKAERKLMEQQRDYEHKIHFLLHKANESDVDGPNDSRIQELEYKSQQLEKELYYYKKSSRDLKKKLREYIASSQGACGPVGTSIGSEVDTGKDLAHNILRIKQSMQEQVVGPTPSQASTPVRVSRKDLRQLSAQEIVVKRSQSQSNAASSIVTMVQELDSFQQNVNKDSMVASAQDSIETGRNPWK